MSSLSTLLQDADPIRHEAPPADAARERIRLTMLREAPVDGGEQPQRTRLALVAAVAIAMTGAAAVGYQVWVQGTTPLLAAVRFEVRLAENHPVPGLLVAQVAGTDDVIYLHPDVIVSNDDIAQSWVSEESPGRFGISVQFMPSGTVRMRQATATHVGRPVAVLIDGVVVMAPVLRSPIGDSAMITGNYTRDEAQRIVDGITTP